MDLYLLPVKYFPLHPVQCFPLLPVRSCDSDPCFRSLFPVPVSGPRSVSRFGFRFVFRFVSRSVSRFGFRSVSHSVSRSISRFGFRSVSRSVTHIGFCSTILDSRLTPVLVPVPDSVSVSPSSRQRLPLLLALLPHGVALYRRQRLIMDSHSARPRRVRSCGSRPRPFTFCCVPQYSPAIPVRSYLNKHSHDDDSRGCIGSRPPISDPRLGAVEHRHFPANPRPSLGECLRPDRIPPNLRTLREPYRTPPTSPGAPATTPAYHEPRHH